MGMALAAAGRCVSDVVIDGHGDGRSHLAECQTWTPMGMVLVMGDSCLQSDTKHFRPFDVPYGFSRAPCLGPSIRVLGIHFLQETRMVVAGALSYFMELCNAVKRF